MIRQKAIARSPFLFPPGRDAEHLSRCGVREGGNRGCLTRESVARDSRVIEVESWPREHSRGVGRRAPLAMPFLRKVSCLPT